MVIADYSASGIHYSANDTDVVLDLSPSKSRWLVGAARRDGALLGHSVLDLNAAGQRETFLKSLRLEPDAAESVRRLLLSVANRLSADTRAWAQWLGEQSAAQQAELEEAALARRADAIAAALEAGRTVLEDPALLFKVGQVAARLGLAGEARNVRALYLEVTTRICDEVVNLVVKGSSSAGKSHLVKQVLKLFPESAYWEMSGMSPKALIYTDRDFSHTYIIIYEYVGSEDADYFIRTLQSEGCLKYAFVDTSGGTPVTLEIEKPGPTGFITTTTLPVLHEENETRMWSATIDESEAQTQLVTQAVADRFNSRGPDPDLGPWVAAQTWLQDAGAAEAFIAYSHWLADHMPTRPIRVRRDIGRLLQVIQASAILHQVQRDRAPDGRIVADVRDYRNAFVLCAAEFTGAQRPVPDRTMGVLELVQRLYDEQRAFLGPRGESTADLRISYAELIQETHLSKSRLSRLLQPAFDAGLIENDAGRGKPARLLPRMDLLAGTTALPDPDRLVEAFPHLAGGIWVHPLTGATLPGTSPEPSPSNPTTAGGETYSGPPPRNASNTSNTPHFVNESVAPGASNGRATVPATPPQTVEPVVFPIAPTPDYELVINATRLAEVLPELLAAPMLGFDIETAVAEGTPFDPRKNLTALDPRRGRLRLAQFATAERVVLVDCFKLDPKLLVPIFDGGRALVGHNLTFEAGYLLAAGLPVPNGGCLFDTLLAAKVLAAGGERFYQGNTLAEVVQRELGLALDKTEQVSDWSSELTDDQLRYAALDAAIVLPLADTLGARLAAAKLDATSLLEQRVLPGNAWLMHTGAPFDPVAWRALSDAALTEQVELEVEMAELLGAKNVLGEPDLQVINWRSPAQVLKLLQSRGHPITTTDEDSLIPLIEHDPLPGLILKHRDASGRASRNGVKYLRHVDPASGRIHADFKQLGSVAGRWSCSEPNLQQVSRDKRYRACFKPSDGKLLVIADYSQIEMRLAAEASKDGRLLAAFAAGQDVHELTAKLVSGKSEITRDERQAAKAANFGLLYGLGAAGLQQLALRDYQVFLTMAEATRMREKFFSVYRDLRSWQNNQKQGAIETRTVGGRRRLGVKSYMEKLNTPIQGSAADGMKLALSLLWETRERIPSARPVNVIHDELVIEVPAEDAEQAKAWVVDCMEQGMRPYLRTVPVVVEATIAADWSGK